MEKYYVITNDYSSVMFECTLDNIIDLIEELIGVRVSIFNIDAELEDEGYLRVTKEELAETFYNYWEYMNIGDKLEYIKFDIDVDFEAYENDEDFFNMMYGDNVFEAVRAISYGDYRYTDEYVRVNGYGNLDSLSDYDYTVEVNSYGDYYVSNMLENLGVV